MELILLVTQREIFSCRNALESSSTFLAAEDGSAWRYFQKTSECHHADRMNFYLLQGKQDFKAQRASEWVAKRNVFAILLSFLHLSSSPVPTTSSFCSSLLHSTAPFFPSSSFSPASFLAPLLSSFCPSLPFAPLSSLLSSPPLPPPVGNMWSRRHGNEGRWHVL